MAKIFEAPITQTIQNIAGVLVNADSFIAANGGNAPTNTKLLFTAGAEGSVVKSLMLASDSSSAHAVAFYLSTDAGTTKHLLGAINVPINSGSTGAIINVDVLGNAFLIGTAIDQSGKPVLPLAAAARIYVGVFTAVVVSGRTVHITGVAEDF